MINIDVLNSINILFLLLNMKLVMCRHFFVLMEYIKGKILNSLSLTINIRMSNITISITVYSVWNLISAFLDILALLVCFTFICIIIYHLIRIKHNRKLIINDVPLILSINIIFVIFIKSTLQITHVTTPTLMKNFHIQTVFNETYLYRYRAYMFWSIIGVMFLWDFFGFIRVIYPRKL